MYGAAPGNQISPKSGQIWRIPDQAHRTLWPNLAKLGRARAKFGTKSTHMGRTRAATRAIDETLRPKLGQTGAWSCFAYPTQATLSEHACPTPLWCDTPLGLQGRFVRHLRTS